MRVRETEREREREKERKRKREGDTNEYSTCYDDLHVSDENKCKIFMKLKFDIEKEKGINFRALSPCLQSVVGNLHLNSVRAKKNSVSILIIRPN